MAPLSRTPPVAHGLPRLARAGVFAAGDGHGIGKPRLLSPSQVGVVAGGRHFYCERARRCRAATVRPFPGGRYRRDRRSDDSVLSVAAKSTRNLYLTRACQLDCRAITCRHGGDEERGALIRVAL